MIRTENEFQEALKRLENDNRVIEEKRKQYSDMDLNLEQVTLLLEPEICFHEQLKDEVEWYKNVQAGHIEPLKSLTDIGRGLIAFRIASGLTQAQLAQALSIPPSQISRDERNEYRGVRLDRAQKIFDAIQDLVSVKRRIEIRMEPEPISA
jgi:Helix-turn-helix